MNALTDPKQFEVNLRVPEKLSCLFLPKRYKIAHGGRGGAKSWTFARVLLVLGFQQQLRILCLRQVQLSIDESVIALLLSQIDELGLDWFYQRRGKKIIGLNGTEFLFKGLNHGVRAIKSIEALDIAWVEEAEPVGDIQWEIFIPSIRRQPPYGPFGQGSEIWISFNPELASSATYKRFVLDPPEQSFVVKIDYWDNPWFGEPLLSEMLELKRKDEDAYLNVWCGHPRHAVEGAVYAKELRDATLDGRICRVPYNPKAAVHTFWDLGWFDFTAIWFAQRVGLEYRILHYLEDHHKTVPEYMETLQKLQAERKYIYGVHHLPEDARDQQLAAGGLSIIAQLRKLIDESPGLGQRARIVAGSNGAHAVRHNAARTFFADCWFDELNCARGLERLRHYKYEIDPETKLRNRTPVHDEASHASSAFETMALSIHQAVKGRHVSKLEVPEGEHQVVTPEFGPWSHEAPGQGWMR